MTIDLETLSNTIIKEIYTLASIYSTTPVKDILNCFIKRIKEYFSKKYIICY